MSKISTPRELHGKRLIGYNLGFFGILLTDILRGVFIFQFYVYTINLNSILVSIGMAIRLIVAAIFYIVFGVITDNKKPGKLGKRRPFLLYGLPIYFLTNILIWIPPWKCPENISMYWPTAIYMWLILIINAISGTSILSAYSAMLPEQSQTHQNREKVASVNVVFSIIASLFALMLPLFIQSILDDPENVKWWQPSGKVILFYIPIVGSTFAIVGLFFIILTFFSVDESFHKIVHDADTKKLSLWAAFQQMVVPAKDKKYRKFILVGFFTMLSGQILGILVIPFLTYSLGFRGTDYFIYIIISFSCKFGWYFVWKRVQKKYSIIKSYSMCIATSAIASILELFFLMQIYSFELKIVLFIITIGTVLGAIYGFALFAGPLGSALVYEAAIKNGDDNIDKAVSEISGAYFGLSSFLMSIAGAVGSIMIGFILMGSNNENPLIITITLASMSIFYLFALFFLRQIDIDVKLSENKEIKTEI